MPIADCKVCLCRKICQRDQLPVLHYVLRKKCKNVLAQHARTQTHWPGECPAGETLPGLCSREQARSRQIWFFSTQVIFCFLLDFFLLLVTEAVRAAFQQLFGRYFIFLSNAKVFDVYISLGHCVSLKPLW